MALELHSKNIVKIKLPKYFSENFRANLMASPISLNLSSRSEYFYEVGLIVAIALNSFTDLKSLRKSEILETLRKVFAKRCSAIVDHTHRFEGTGFGSFEEKLTKLERDRSINIWKLIQCVSSYRTEKGGELVWRLAKWKKH